MRYVVLCPFVHQPSFDRMWETLHPELRDAAVVIDNTVRNRGAAGSRNVGARAMVAADADWLIDISPVTRFGPPGGRDFLEQVAAHPDAWIVQSSTPVNWHCIAWSRRMFERVGLFDENFHPLYGEDGDISRRVHLAAAEDGLDAVWACVDTDAWVTMYGHAQRLAGIQIDQERLWSYYVAKHGGRSGAETHTRPFDRDDVGLDWWPTPPDPRALVHPGRPA